MTTEFELWNGRKVTMPILVIILSIITIFLMLLTVPFHIAKWLIDGRGFVVKKGGNAWSYAPGWTWVIITLVTYAVLGVVLL